MATQTNEPALTKKQLIEVVRTGREIAGVGTMRALAMLRRRPRRDAGELLREVAADPAQQARFRHMAAMGLYELGGSRADRELADAARQADDQVAPVIALGLGRVGTRDRLALVEAMTERAVAHLRPHAEFGATLLAYRHGLDGHDVKAPSGRRLQTLDDPKALPIEIGRATARQAEAAAKALTDQPLDVKLTIDNAQRLVCGSNSFVWLWTVKAAGDLQTVGRGVAGVLFRKSRFDETYALSGIGLATPGRSGVALTLHRADSGAVMYAGTAARDGSLQVRAVSRPGVAAVDIQVNVKAGAVEVQSARSASVARKARTPKVA